MILTETRTEKETMKTTTMMVKMDMAKEANMVIRSKEPDNTQVVGRRSPF